MNSLKITKAVKICMYVYITACTMLIVSNIIQINLLNGFENNIYNTFQIDSLADNNDSRQEIIAQIYLIVLVLSFFIVGRWIYISSKINHLSGVKNLNFSAGWSVGWYFIPIANIITPYRAMKEIYRASFDVEDWDAIKIPKGFLGWWACWLISNALSYKSFEKGMETDKDYSIQDLITISLLDITSGIFEILCAFLLLKIVSVIGKNHENKNFELQYKINY